MAIIWRLVTLMWRLVTLGHNANILTDAAEGLVPPLIAMQSNNQLKTHEVVGNYVIQPKKQTNMHVKYMLSDEGYRRGNTF